MQLSVSNLRLINAGWKLFHLEVFWYPSFPNFFKIKTKIIWYPKTSCKIIFQPPLINLGCSLNGCYIAAPLCSRVLGAKTRLNPDSKGLNRVLIHPNPIWYVWMISQGSWGAAGCPWGGRWLRYGRRAAFFHRQNTMAGKPTTTGSTANVQHYFLDTIWANASPWKNA